MVRRLQWGNKTDIKAALEHGTKNGNDVDEGSNRSHGACRYDLVVGSDITYWPAPLDLLIETIVQLVSAEGTVVIAHKDRAKSNGREFFRDLAKHFRESGRVQVRDMADEVGQTCGDITEDDGCFHVFAFRGLLV